MSAPLYEKLVEYAEKSCYPFHMPGHKQGRGMKIPSDFLKMDITEIEGFDNLHHPKGIIKEAQDLCAKTFGAEKTFFLVNGSSSGLVAAVLTVCGEGEKILIARNCHKSVYHGLVLAGAEPVYILPERIEEIGLFGGISPEKVKDALKKHPDCKAFLLTSPTFEGFTSDLKQIADILHEKNKILIVDEAHGSHMKFHDGFPKTALEQGADLVVQSVHKTLCCFTQTALLHIQGKRIDQNRLRDALAMMQTTSPSYLLMGGIDLCREELDRYGKERFELYFSRLIQLREVLSGLDRISLIGKERCQKGAADLDYGKLVFYLDVENFSGVDFGIYLRQNHKIQLEMEGICHGVAMTTVADEQSGFHMLCKAILELETKLKRYPKRNSQKNMVFSLPDQVILPRQAAFGQKDTIPFLESAGRICAEFVVPYPPGIPVLAPGETISMDKIQEIVEYKRNGISVIGTRDSDLGTIQVIK